MAISEDKLNEFPGRFATDFGATVPVGNVFDPWRSAVLLVAGDKSGYWDMWYRPAIPRAGRLYEEYLAERRKEMGL